MGLSAGSCFNLDDTDRPVQHDNLVSDWRDEMIYQVLTDRFANGDSANDMGVKINDPARYHGGDWKGIEDHLDYIQDLGVTSLWISPIIKNVDSDAGIDGYHGYWGQDYTALNPHMGDMGALRSLVNAAHARNIKVILDIVTNHVGQAFYYDINGNGQPDEAVWGGGDITLGPDNMARCWKDSDCTQFPNLVCQGATTTNQGGCAYAATPIQHRTEYDPEYEEPEVLSRTSLGVAGPAPVIFYQNAESNHMPPFPAAFAKPENYHRRGRVYNWNVDNQVVYGDFPGGLKDLATENQEVRDAMFYVYGRWLSLVDFDGLRIDTLKHVEHGFWQDFAPRIRAHAKSLGKKNFLMFGEAFDGSDSKLASYVAKNEVDSVFYFSQMYAIKDAFRGGSSGYLHSLHEQRQGLYYQEIQNDSNGQPQKILEAQPDGAGQPPYKILVNFMDNHDVARFLNDGSPVEALHAALTFLYTEDGIPCLYYGTEQDFNGGNDPNNREDMWSHSNNFSTSGATFQWVKQLTTLRKKYEPLRRGDMRWQAWSDNGPGILAFERYTDSQNLLIVINTSPDQKTLDVTTSFPSGTALTNVLNDADQTDSATAADKQVDDGKGGKTTIHYVPLTLDGRATKIFVQQ
jgi:glycosidase